ncbi:MAG: OmpA family protein [Phreatobacter sp.]|uniref:OmpA family protein n=1 Tax=Phreatobacter sp. TaxID=1966341 RepID=UPI001A470BA9|nr:OmpA family protein [Phreatobacter sp.]MBL8569434.1 OmpA family protein [Phreatobacter sp.]
MTTVSRLPKHLKSTLPALLAILALPLADAAAQAPPPAAPAAPAAAPPALPPPVPLRQAFEKAAGDVLKNAAVPAGTRVDLLIDPLIDGNTGAQSSATRSLEAQLRQLIGKQFSDKFAVQPFSAENVAKNPYLFIGTFTPIHATAQAAGPKDAYRVCFAILDLKTKQIVSKGFARATTAGINAVPTPAYADSPVWTKDPAVDGYIRTCQGTKVGDPINPNYVDKTSVAALIAEAIKAYDERRYGQALDLYTRARAQPGGAQLRVLNGIYLSQLKLNRRADASKALGELVDFGLKSEKLGMMMLFTRGSTAFAPSAIARAYPDWIKAVAEKAQAGNACLQLVGHTSRTGTEPFNDRLSALRSAAIRQRMERLAPALAKSLRSNGVGWRENIVGTGRDDASDALDRRVEFKVVKCA